MSLRNGSALSRRIFTWQVALFLILCVAALPRLIDLEHVPAGSDGDVAWYGINALDWVDRGVWPYYIRELYGPEPLSVYMIGLMVPFAGVNTTTARLATALWGTLTVGLLFLAAYWLLADEPRSTRLRAGLLAALAAALSLHAIHVSRLGLPAPYLPGAIALMTAATAWAHAKGGYWRWVLAGVALALTQYIYIADRVLAGVVVLWFAYDWLSDRAGFRARWRGWVVMGVTAFLLVLPNLYLFATAPRALLGRAEAATPTSGALIWQIDTSRYGGPLGLVIQKLINNFRSVGISWPAGPYTAGLEQPILTVVFFTGFLLTVALLLRHPRQRAFAWLWLAIPVALVPDLISSIIPQPHAMRQIDVLAFVFLLSGVGLAYAWHLVMRLPVLGRGFVLAGAALLVVVPFVIQVDQYLFVLPPQAYQNPELSWRADQASLDMSQRIISQPDKAYLIPYTEYDRSTVAWTTAGVFRQRRSAIDAQGQLNIPSPPAELTVMLPTDPYRVRWDGHLAQVDNRLWVLLQGDEALFLPPLEATQESELFDQIDASSPETLIDRSGQQIASFYDITAPPDLFITRQVIDNPVDVTFGDSLRLVGYSVPSTDLTPGQSFFATLYWKTLKPPTEDYEIFVQLWNDASQSVAEWQDVPFGAMYRTRIWRTDEIVATHQWLVLPEDAAAGRYRLIAGLYRTLYNQRLPATGGNADSPNAVALLTDMRNPLADRNETGTTPPWQTQFGDTFHLSGLDVALDGESQTAGESWDVTPGQTLTVKLVWETLQRPARDYNLFVHLIREGGQQPAAQTDGLIRPEYPTGIWREGDQLGQEVTLTIPPDLPAGRYVLWTGMYYWQTGERLAVTRDGAEQPDQRLQLGTLVVK